MRAQDGTLYRMRGVLGTQIPPLYRGQSQENYINTSEYTRAKLYAYYIYTTLYNYIVCKCPHIKERSEHSMIVFSLICMGTDLSE